MDKRRIPVFLEAQTAATSEQTQICTKIRMMLFQHKIAPLPFASTLKELGAVLTSTATVATAPAIVVINTFGVKDLMPILDSVIKELPVMYLRRNLFAGESGVGDYIIGDPNKMATMQLIGNMTPRLTSVWPYGSKHLSSIAQHAATSLLSFLESGDFRRIERGSKYQP